MVGRQWLAGGALVALGLAAGGARAGDLTLGVAAGTPGIGVEAGWSFNDYLALRAGAQGFSYSYDGEESGIEYDSDLDLRSAALYLDWHPFGGSFHLSAGAFANGNEVNAQAVPGPGGTYEIDGIEFTTAEVGNLAGTVDFDSVAPYLGLGWRGRGGEDGGLGFSVGVGVLFQGSPDVALSSTGGSLSGDPLLQDAIAAEEQELEDDVDQYEFYPVLSLGVTYTF